MPSPSPIPLIGVVFLLFASECPAMQIRAYSPARHDRFTGFPEAPVINADSFFDGSQFVGVGWQPDDSRWQFTLVSRSHVLFATHAAPAIGTEIRFLSADNQTVSRRIIAKAVAGNPDGSESDLVLLQLDSPIEAEADIPPLPYLDLASKPLYLNRLGTIFGMTARTGVGMFDGFDNISEASLNPTSVIRYTYDSADGGDDDAKLEIGDSGSPQFGEVGDVIGLVGINASIDTEGDLQSNFAGFVPDYVAELDSILAPFGYRMIPANTPTTTLTTLASVLTPTPRKGNPLEVTLVLNNIGIQATGNLEAAFKFSPGGAPDQINGTGWVEYEDDDKTQRRALLEASSATTLTLRWDAAPLVDSIDWQLDLRSDKTIDSSFTKTIRLLPSFNDWASDLTLNGQTDDPDQDQLINLIEYAIGSDPDDGSNLLGNGESAVPAITRSDQTLSFSFPERSDAIQRGLSYIPEWSTSLSPDSWSAVFPEGLSTSTSPLDPDLPGFMKRTFSWPVDGPIRFVRLNVLLDE